MAARWCVRLKNSFIDVVDEEATDFGNSSHRSKSAEAAPRHSAASVNYEVDEAQFQRLQQLLVAERKKDDRVERNISDDALQVLGRRLHLKLQATRLAETMPKERTNSSVSLDTMAPDCASVIGDFSSSGDDAQNPSSNYIASMVPNLSDDGSEDGGVEFDLTISESDCHNTPSTEVTLRPSIDQPSEQTHAWLQEAMRRDCFHGSVSEKNNLAEEFLKTGADHVAPTTLMVRNVPNRYKAHDLIDELASLGFESTFDFVFLPIDRRTRSSVGYAFVNFTTAAFASDCTEKLNKHYFTKHVRAPGKLAAASVAHVQGLENNLTHYEKNSANIRTRKQQRPILLACAS